eukprot:scaffold455_cov116-Isochrysis_galbana.AAC.13
MAQGVTHGHDTTLPHIHIADHTPYAFLSHMAYGRDIPRAVARPCPWVPWPRAPSPIVLVDPGPALLWTTQRLTDWGCEYPNILVPPLSTERYLAPRHLAG